jgi:hypothetical protein
MATTHSKPKTKKAAPPQRVKGETVTPTNTMRLVEIVGVTDAHRKLGVSTTTLHKARKQGIVSRVVEIAATATLEQLGKPAQAAPQPFPVKHITPAAAGDSVMLLVSVDRAKAELIQDFASRLGAEVKAY